MDTMELLVSSSTRTLMSLRILRTARKCRHTEYTYSRTDNTSLYTGTVVGKQIAKAFYGKAHDKSYYFGCSTGGRQGFKAAQDFSEEFDGIVAGAPAIAFNNLTSWSGESPLID